jgi:hypothetical protein
MCYFCPKVSDEIGILLHTIETHDACSTFSMRKSVFDEKIGCNAYRSQHFPVRISEIKLYHEKGFTFNINTETSRITFRRKHDDLNQYNSLDGHLNDKIHHKATQTENADIYSLLSDGLESLHEMNRYDDFVSVLKCICEGIMTDNIAFQLLMDVGKNTWYTDQTLAFWVTVKKLFKGKGINFFRGLKGQGLNILRNDNIAPRDCRIKFVVSSNPILTKESSKYTLDAENPGLLKIPLDSFAANNAEKDVKRSIDGKQIALGLREAGDENLGGYEVAPTLQERKTRLENEIQNISNMKSKIELQSIDGFQSMKDLDDVDTAMLKESSLVAITHMSKRIQERREFNGKRTLHLNNLMNSIEGE